MWPLVGQRISVDKPQSSSLLMAAGIIVAQLVMIPVAALAGRLTEARGRKLIFLIGFMSLPIRGVLFTLSDQPAFVISVQILDGVGVGVYGVLSVLVVADLTRGTGHFNLTQGAIATASGVGASLSMLLAGLIVEYAGYQAAFLSLAAVAAVALLIFWTLMPETKEFATAGGEAAADRTEGAGSPCGEQATSRQGVRESRTQGERPQNSMFQVNPKHAAVGPPHGANFFSISLACMKAGSASRAFW